MFGNLPAHEKQAFFGILDEYFQSRPHLIAAQHGGQSEQAAPLIRQYTPPAPTPAAAPAPAPGRLNPPVPAARNPASVSSSARTFTPPAGIVSGKSIGSMKTSSPGAAFGSLLKSNQQSKDPITPGEALSGLHAVTSAANRMNLNSQQRRPPAPPPPPQQQEAESLGQAEVVYDYKGTDAEDLNVRKYEIVSLVEKVNDDWWKAETNDGRSGLVPANYIKII